MHGKLWTFFFALIAVALVILLPVAPAQASSVNVVIENESLDMETAAGNQVEWSWYIYNNDSSPVHVQAELDFQDGASHLDSYQLEFFGKTGTVQVDPGSGERLVLIMTASRLSSSTMVHAEVLITVTNLSDVSQSELLSFNVTLDISSIYSGEDSYNHILGVFVNTLPYPLDGPLGALLVTMALYGIIAVSLYAFVLPMILRRELASKTAFYNQTLKIMRTPVLLVVLLFGIVQSFSIIGADEATLIAVGSISMVLYILLGAKISWALYKIIVRHLLIKFNSKRLMDNDLSLLPLMNWIGLMSISLSALSGVLSVLGFDIMVILTGAGILGLAISLGAQDTLKKFFAGLSLLIERPFKEGDLLQMDDGIVVEVVRVGMRSTTFYNTFDPQYFTIPNDVVANSKIVNVLRPDARYKAKVDIGVAYGSDISMVKKAMMEAAMDHPEVLKTPDEMPIVRFLGFGDSSLNFRLFTWVADFRDHYRILGELRESIDANFREYGIEIPFPQRDIWIREKKDD
ncbi:MAG: mechanosensitive ion channel [Candidatus Methanomethylophilaceae archaeon]|nr:mechanosensitive ion channel [Candidatus Methanomethylophilaceae archaeon]